MTMRTVPIPRVPASGRRVQVGITWESQVAQDPKLFNFQLTNDLATYEGLTGKPVYIESAPSKAMFSTPVSGWIVTANKDWLVIDLDGHPSNKSWYKKHPIRIDRATGFAPFTQPGTPIKDRESGVLVRLNSEHLKFRHRGLDKDFHVVGCGACAASRLAECMHIQGTVCNACNHMSCIDIKCLGAGVSTCVRIDDCTFARSNRLEPARDSGQETDQVSAQRHKCSCELLTLMRDGCKCGGV